MKAGIIYERFCMPVTFRCNLSCELCAEHSPYDEMPYQPSLRWLKEQIDQLFLIVEHIGKFDITGGEPFLRNDLADILRYLQFNYQDKIDVIRITTNGTILPTENFMQVAADMKEKIHIIIDHYGISERYEDVYKRLTHHKISSEVRDYSDNLHCDGWVDYGDLSLKHTKEEAKKIFNKCLVPKLGFFTCMVNGIIFPCARARLLYEKLITEVAVDLFDPELTEKGKKARMCSIVEEDEMLDACRFCNGLCEDATRYAPAKQLEIPRIEACKKMEYEDWRLDYGKIILYTQTYNNEKTIARTIESILNQTKREFTYFICNNASTDSTGEIIKRYADKDPRIVYVSCENNDILGVVSVLANLLACVPLSKTHYYAIVDGDDSVESDFVEKILYVAEQEEPDMIVPAVNRIDMNTGQLINQRKLDYNMIVSGKEKVKDFLRFRSMLLCQWGKAYKRNMRYPKNTMQLFYRYGCQVPTWFHQQDTAAVLCAFHEFDRVGFIGRPVYNYYVSLDSICHSYSPDRIQSDILMFNLYMDFLKQYPPVDKLNHDFCYAIYLSLIEDTVRSIKEASTDNDQKMVDLLNVLDAKPTVELLKGQFDPMFHNLTDRRGFFGEIFKYMREILETETDKKNRRNNLEKIKQYESFLVERRMHE